MYENETSCSVITANIFTWQVDWMKQNNISRSEFLRTALTEHIARIGEANIVLDRLYKRKKLLNAQLLELNEQIHEAESEQTDKVKRDIIKKIRSACMSELRYNTGWTNESVLAKARKSIVDFEETHLTQEDIEFIVQDIIQSWKTR